LMPKDTESLGNNKAPACESRGFVRKRKKGCILTHLHNLSIYDEARFFRDSIKRILAILFLHEQTLKDVCIKQTCEINRYICTQLWADI
ncbi:hypothetical protein PO070_15670, partial [Bacteroides stercoris]|uniref:hypothetical protein n=2 Tax=Bacteroides TaxID=816 RepID=UPI00232DF43C